MTDYVVADPQSINASVEGQSKVTVNKVSSSISLTGQIVPLRKVFIELGDYEIKQGIPVGKSTASALYSPASSLRMTQSLVRRFSDPTTVDYGQTLRWALGTSAGTVGYWVNKVVYNATFNNQIKLNGVNTVTINNSDDVLSVGDNIVLVTNTEADGEYTVSEVDTTSNFFRFKTISTLPTFTSCTFYKKPELVPYPNSQTASGSFNWSSPVEVSGGVALSTTYTVLYSKSNQYSVLEISTARQHWFYPGLKIKISNSAWNLNNGTSYNGFSWVGSDGNDVYEILEVTGSTSFTVVAKPLNSYDGSSVYLINANSYAYPDIEASLSEYSFRQDDSSYSYDSLSLDGSIKHLYSRGQRVGAVDEFSIAIVASPTSTGSAFGILSEADNTIYESNNYSFNSSSSSSVPITLIKRLDTLVTVTMGSPGYTFSPGDTIRISDCLDSSFNGIFKINSVTDSFTFNYYQKNVITNSTASSGNVYVYASDQDVKYEMGSPFIWQEDSTVYFGDNQNSPDSMNTGNYTSYNYPNIYLMVARKNEIDLYIATQKTIYKKTTTRKNAISRKNLVPNSNFETNSTGWSGGTRGNTAGKAFYGTYSYRADAAVAAAGYIASYSRNTSGLITLNFSVDPGASWAAGDFIYIANYSGEVNWPTMISGDFYAPIKTKSGVTITIDQNESNMSQSSYTAVTVASTGGNSAVPYKLDAINTDYITINSSDAYHGVAYCAVDTPFGGAFVRFYNSSNTLLETRFLCVTNPNLTTWGQTSFFKRTQAIFSSAPATTSKIRLYIAGSSDYIDAVSIEPNSKNFNYFIGDGPKYDLDFVFGRMSGTFDSSTIFTGSLMEIDYWDSAVDYNSVTQIVSKMRTVYGG